MHNESVQSQVTQKVKSKGHHEYEFALTSWQEYTKNMFILHINTIILALLYLGQCTNMLIITALVCHSAVSGYLSYGRSTPFLSGLSPVIMSCAARKKLMLCIRWMRTVYIDFIFILNIPAMVFITIKNTTHNIKKN